MIRRSGSVQKFVIVGGNRLKGTIRTSGSKNATLPILAASILNAGRHHLRGTPVKGRLSDERRAHLPWGKNRQ